MNAPAFAVTVLRALAGKRLVKTFATDRRGQVVKRGSDKAAEFVLERHDVADADTFFALLGALERRTDACIVRAVPGPWCPPRGQPMFRLLHPQPAFADPRGGRVSREAAKRQTGIGERLFETTWLPTLVEAPTPWVLLDFEQVEGERDWRRELAGTAAWLKLRLPDAFADARCWYQATGSAADPSRPDLGGSEVRMRLAFVLSRPLTEGQLKTWLGGIPGLDAATFRSVQEIYVGRPIFGDGLVDPMPVRSGVLDGLEDVVPVPGIEAPHLPRREAFAGQVHARSAEGLGRLESPGLDAALERLAEAGGAAGGVRSGLMGAAFAYVADVGRDRVDIDALADALAEAAAPYRSAAEIAGYGLEGMIAWCLERAPEEGPPRPHYPAQGLPAEEAVARLRAEMAAAVGAAVAWRATAGPEPAAAGVIDVDGDPPPPVVGIRAGAGLGKTGCALGQIAAVPGVEQLNIELYVPTQALAEELADRARAAAPCLRVLVIKGRGSADRDGNPMCGKTSLAEGMARAGLSVMGHLCKLERPDGLPPEACEFATGCRYLAQFVDPAPAIRVMAHTAMFTPRNKALPAPDLVVIDEAFWPGSSVHQRLALDRLTEAGRWRVRPRKGEPKRKAEDRELEAEDFAIRARDALLDGRDPRTVVNAEGCRHVAGIEWGSRTGPRISPAMRLADQERAWNTWQRDECAKAGRFWNLLAAEPEHPERPIQRIVLERDAPTRDGDRRHRLHLHHRRELTLPAVPVILLDADLEPLIARKFWPEVKVVEIPVQQRARVVQVIDKTCSRRFLLGGGGDADQARADRRLAELRATAPRLLGGGGGLLVTYKAAIDRLELPPEVRSLHLGNLRGRDGFKELDRVVVAGRLEPTVRDLERMARAMFGDEAEPLRTVPEGDHGGTRYPTERRRCRMVGTPADTLEDHLAGPEVAVSVHPDRRAQALLEAVRERELEQAVGRLRLVHRARPATVYLLTNLPLNLGVSEVVTWDALARDREGEACHRWKGVWLCSAGQRAKAAPDLWPTRAAAKQARRRKGGTESSKEDSRAVRTPFPAYPAWGRTGPPREAVTLVEYRLAGQRGSAHRAYVPGSAGCTGTARADLEAVTGAVATVTIVGTVRRERPAMLECRGEPAPLGIPLRVPAPFHVPDVGEAWSFAGPDAQRRTLAGGERVVPPPRMAWRPPGKPAAFAPAAAS